MTTDDATTWKRCSTCKKPIAYGAGYFTCNVSTCNRKGTDFAFCGISCWDAHVPVLRHRDSWAEEAQAPTAGHPELAVLVLEQAIDWCPAFAGITRLEERGRLDPAIKHVRLRRSARRDLPDLGKRAA